YAAVLLRQRMLDRVTERLVRRHPQQATRRRAFTARGVPLGFLQDGTRMAGDRLQLVAPSGVLVGADLQRLPALVDAALIPFKRQEQQPVGVSPPRTRFDLAAHDRQRHSETGARPQL